MKAVEKAGKIECAEISITLPLLPTLPRAPSTGEGPSALPPQTQPSFPLKVASLPMQLAPPRMVCLRPTSQDCLSVTQPLHPMKSASENGEGTAHSIFISTSSTPSRTTAVASASYSSSSSSGPVLLAPEGGKTPIEGRRKRPAASLPTPRQNKGRGVCTTDAMNLEVGGSATLSPREQRALRRKEKSRLAAKMRRNQESTILSCLLQALPVSLPDTAASDGAKTPSGLNLEKSGVIRMAGQTLFLYNSLSQVLGTKAVPFISLLSKALYGLLVHPTDSTVVYATPPLAEAINWPWINLIGARLESLTDEGKLPTRAGETVRLRILEQTNSPTKSSVHVFTHTRPTTPLRSPSHSPTSTVSSSTATSGVDQASPLWSPHLYRSSKNGTSGASLGSQLSAFATGNKAVPYLICTCFAILRVPITKAEDTRPSTATDPPSLTSKYLRLYLLQPALNLGLSKDTVESSSLQTAAQLGKTSSTPLSPTSTVSSSSSSCSSFHRNKERYFLNRQRRLLMQNPPPKPLEDDLSCPRDFFCAVLDRKLDVKRVENSDPSKAGIFSSMVGQSYLDLIFLQDLQTVSKVLTECIQRKTSIWTPAYRLRMPFSQSTATGPTSGPSKFIWVRTLFSSTFDSDVRCLHQPIREAQISGVQVYLHSTKSSTSTTGNSASRHHIGNSLPMGSGTTTSQVKRPIRVLKLQPQQQQPLPTSTLQPLHGSQGLQANSGPYLAPLATTPTKDTQIVYESPACLTPQTLVTTPWVIYTRSVSAPQTSLTKSIVPIPQNSSFNFLIPEECHEISSQQSNKIPRLSSSPSISEQLQTDKRPTVASSPTLNLPDMLQELGPETLAMLEENEDAKSDSVLTSLSFDDILSSISITTSSGDEMNQEKQICTSGSFCSSESSPPSLPESFASSASCTRNTDQSSHHQEQEQQQRELSLFSDVELDGDLPSDTDEFWDALVTNVMILPLDTTNLSMDVR